MQKNFQQYSIIDFVGDDDFLKHHLHPTSESSQFWEDWQLQNPSKKSVFLEAQRLFEAVRLGLSEYARTYLSPEAEANLLARIRLTNESNNLFEKPIVSIWRNKWTVSAAAASVLLLLGVFFWKLQTDPVSPYYQQIALLNKSVIEKNNVDFKPQLIHLLDGTAVLLSAKSRLSYSENFGSENRIVYLDGEATFDVAKDPSKPFYVYANELITKVLGTKFKITAYEKGKDVVVTVQHGQVSVYRNEKSEKNSLKGVLLLPNQQVVFARQSEQFNKTIIREPQIVALNNKEIINFDFDETPVYEVFERLKKAYNIDIIYNSEILKDCQLTASLTDESLFQKLDIITKSIGASYETVEGQIVITSKGCK